MAMVGTSATRGEKDAGPQRESITISRQVWNMTTKTIEILKPQQNEMQEQHRDMYKRLKQAE